MWYRALLVTLPVLLMCGCATTARLVAISAERTGCPAEEIEITDDCGSLGGHIWTVACRDKAFYCTSREPGGITCREIVD